MAGSRPAATSPAPATPAAGLTIQPRLAQQIARDYLQQLTVRGDLEAQIEQLQMRLMISERQRAELEARLAPAEPPSPGDAVVPEEPIS